MTLSVEDRTALLPSYGEEIRAWRERLMLATEQAEKQLGNSADEPEKTTAPFDSSPTLDAADSDCPEFEQLVAKLNALHGTCSYGYWFFAAQSLSGIEEVHASEPGCELPAGAETPPNSVRPLRSKDKGERS